MGGWGSGPRRPGGRKPVADDCPAVDVAALRRRGLLAPGASGPLPHAGPAAGGVVAGATFALDLGADAGTLRVAYTLARTGERVEYPIRLARTPCRFGGGRWWLVCPLAVGGGACGRRAGKLYLLGRSLGCRHCHRLTYRSTRESDRRVYAAARRGLHVRLFTRAEVGRMSVADLGFAL